MSNDRIRMQSLQSKVCSADEAAMLIKDGMYIGISGFTKFGDARAVPKALARRAKNGDKFCITLMTGASLGSDIDEDLGDLGITVRRLPYQGSPQLRKHINCGDVMYTDQHLSHTGEYIRCGHIHRPDIAIIDATYIDEKGGIVCTTSVGNNSAFALSADKIIVEINETHPVEMYGLHDIYVPEARPGRKPIPLVKPGDKIGTPAIQVDPSKIAAIVVHQMGDTPVKLTDADDETNAIAGHLIEFFKHEVKKGRMTNSLLPLQSGVGAVANAVLKGFESSPFSGLSMFTEVAQDTVIDLMLDAGKMDVVSTSALSLSQPYLDRVHREVNKLQGKLVLRPQEISNHPECIRRLGVIATNTALEFDIYGNVNSTHVLGTKMMNGIGGSGDFARNAAYTVFVTKSYAKGGALSSVVPMVTHHDHTEHDVDILITELGLADLRGLAPRERAKVIIENTVHPNFKEILSDYAKEAAAKGGHTPHILSKAFSLHERFEATGSMLPK
ncbi:Succinyl-CoA:coenzyme A transferase [uncultured delta proteobacterium]|uniref:Succinyl-CoA:coenzyme A transferase n=1 Tax=uncultured delta proteobacterium TaxID=34034 RepID=A0A212JPQ9_9DELT|nr:Succinyl-CoA:coenzyme A transferase [uncultured delta proteobacterium]